MEHHYLGKFPNLMRVTKILLLKPDTDNFFFNILYLMMGADILPELRICYQRYALWQGYSTTFIKGPS